MTCNKIPETPEVSSLESKENVAVKSGKLRFTFNYFILPIFATLAFASIIFWGLLLSEKWI